MMSEITPPITRQPFGSGHVYADANGIPVPSVTSILRDGVAKPALISWAGNATAEFAVDNWSKLAKMGAASRYEAIRNARWERTRAAAIRGTALHEAAEAMLHGRPVIIPDESRPQVEAYARFLSEWHVAPLAVERVIASIEHGYAGTFDLCAMLSDEPYLLDLKTNKSGVYPTALQLAAYKHADWSEPELGEVVAWLRKATTAAVWLRPDGAYELLPVTVGRDELQAFLAAMQLASWNKTGSALIGSALAVPSQKQEAL